MKYYTFVCIAFLLVQTAAAERKPLKTIHRVFELGVSEVQVPNPKRADGVDIVDRLHEVRLDSLTGVYTYTYWTENGEKVEERYISSDQVSATVACSVRYDQATQEYTYTYKIDVNSSSRQSLANFVIDLDPTLIDGTSASGSWEGWFSHRIVPGTPKWAFFTSLGNHIPPGGELTAEIVSRYGPVLTTCYLKGNVPNATYSIRIPYVSPRQEGVTGTTLAPGRVPVGQQDLKKHLTEIMDAALEWGWVDTLTYNNTLRKINSSQAINKDSYSELRKGFRASKMAVREPEVGALLDHIGTDLFDLPPEPDSPEDAP